MSFIGALGNNTDDNNYNFNFNDLKIRIVDIDTSNYAKFLDFNSSNYTEEIGLNSSNYTDVIGLNSSNYTDVIGFNSSNYTDVIGFNSSNYTDVIDNYSSNYTERINQELSDRIGFPAPLFPLEIPTGVYFPLKQQEVILGEVGTVVGAHTTAIAGIEQQIIGLVGVEGGAIGIVAGAVTLAGEAYAKAGQALTAANQAKTIGENAQEDADTAQTTANTADGKANTALSIWNKGTVFAGDANNSAYDYTNNIYHLQTGNVGIGVNNDTEISHKLLVNGNTKLNGNVLLNGSLNIENLNANTFLRFYNYSDSTTIKHAGFIYLSDFTEVFAMDTQILPIELRISGDPIIQVYSDKVDITKNLNVVGDITFTGNLYQGNSLFTSGGGEDGGTGGTNYNDENRLDYQFLKEPIENITTISNIQEPTIIQDANIHEPLITQTANINEPTIDLVIQEPTSSPSVSKIIIDSDYKYMSFNNNNTADTSLIAHYKFDDDTNIGLDSNPNSTKYNLVTTGISLSNDSITGKSAVVINEPLYNNSITQTFLTSLGTYTFSLWLKNTSNDNWTSLFDTRVSSKGVQVYSEIPSSSQATFGKFLINQSGQNITADIDTNDGVWHHIVLSFEYVSTNGVIDTYNLYLYFDGNPVVLSATTWNMETTTKVLYIGEAGNNIYGMNGKIDDFRLYNRVLTQSEITSLYTIYNIPIPQETYSINFLEQTEVQILLLDNLKYIETAPFNTSGETTINVGNPSTFDTITTNTNATDFNTGYVSTITGTSITYNSPLVIVRYKYKKTGTIQPITINDNYKYISFPQTTQDQTYYDINFIENTEVQLAILSNTYSKYVSPFIQTIGKINIIVGNSGNNSSFGSISTDTETTPYNTANSDITGTNTSYNQAIVIVRYKYTRPIIQAQLIDSNYKYISFVNNTGLSQITYTFNLQEPTEIQLLLLDDLKYIEEAPFTTQGSTTINVGNPSTYDTLTTNTNSTFYDFTQSHLSTITGSSTGYNKPIVIVRYKYTRPQTEVQFIDDNYKYVSFPYITGYQTVYGMNFPEETEVQLLLLNSTNYNEITPFTITTGAAEIRIGLNDPTTFKLLSTDDTATTYTNHVSTITGSSITYNNSIVIVRYKYKKTVITQIPKYGILKYNSNNEWDVEPVNTVANILPLFNSNHFEEITNKIALKNFDNSGKFNYEKLSNPSSAGTLIYDNVSGWHMQSELIYYLINTVRENNNPSPGFAVVVQEEAKLVGLEIKNAEWGKLYISTNPQGDPEYTTDISNGAGSGYMVNHLEVDGKIAGKEYKLSNGSQFAYSGQSDNPLRVGTTNGLICEHFDGVHIRGVNYYGVKCIGNLSVTGTKQFKIPHPILENKSLVHNSVESPRVENLYRGIKQLINGKCEINIDTDCNENGGLTEGTYQSFNRHSQLFLQNHNTFDRLKGIITGNKINVICEDDTANYEINWMVISERCDKNIMETTTTDDNGRLLCEVENTDTGAEI
jgi:hypothetical protein